MLSVERRLALIDLLEEQEVFSVDDLSRRFAVTPQTVRRDLRALEAQGLLRRAYGGAVARTAEHSLESNFRSREEVHRPQKEAIARAAVGLLVPGQAVLFDGSTTVLQLARVLPMDFEGTSVVNALPIAFELSRRPRLNVTFLGGTLRHTSLSFAGPLAETVLRKLYVDCVVLSARGCSLAQGLTEANPYEAQLKEIMVANTTRVILLVDSSKLGRAALLRFAPLSAVHTLVTDAGAAPETLEELSSTGVAIIVADPLPADSPAG